MKKRTIEVDIVIVKAAIEALKFKAHVIAGLSQAPYLVRDIDTYEWLRAQQLISQLKEWKDAKS